MPCVSCAATCTQMLGVWPRDGVRWCPCTADERGIGWDCGGGRGWGWDGGLRMPSICSSCQRNHFKSTSSSIGAACIVIANTLIVTVVSWWHATITMNQSKIKQQPFNNGYTPFAMAYLATNWWSSNRVWWCSIQIAMKGGRRTIIMAEQCCVTPSGPWVAR